MTSSNPYLERAKQGDPDAIAYLMRRSLQSKGIEVSAQDEGDTLLVTLEGAQPVNREAVVAFIRKGMQELDISSLRTVQVDWRQQGSLLSEWTEEIVLSDGDGIQFGDASLSGLDDPIDPPPAIDDMDLADEDNLGMDDGPAMAPVEMAMEDGEGDDAMMEDESIDMVDESPAVGAKKKASTSPLILLLLLAAVLGGGWYFYREGYFDSFVAQLPEPMRQYFPPTGGGDDVATDPAATTPAEGAAVADGSDSAAADSSDSANDGTPATGESPAPAASPEDTAAAPPAEVTPSPTATASPAPEAAPQTAPSPAATTAPAPAASAEPWFSIGVREAIKAANLTQSAKTPAEWTAVAKAWQAAVDAMKKVPDTDANYATAQDRIPTYEKNLAYAKGNAQ